MNLKDIIIQKIDLPVFISECTNVQVRPVGNGYRCSCPIHDNSENPNSMFIDNNGGYYCYVCGSGGDVINFYSDFYHVSYSAAEEALANYLNINLDDCKEYQDSKRIQGMMNKKIESSQKDLGDIKEYLTKDRCLTEETINNFGLGYDGSLIIPLIDQNGRSVGIAKRQFNKQPKYINCKNNELYDKSEFLFNLNRARRCIKDSVYVVEGYMDAMSGDQLGLPTIAYCGSELHKDQIRHLSSYLQEETSIIIFPDNDEAGLKRLPRVRQYFKQLDHSRQVRVAIVPDGIKDMNDMLKAGINPADIPTEHIDKFVIRWQLSKCNTIEEEYACSESYIKTVSSEMIKVDIIKMLADRWGQDVAELRKYFNALVEDTDDIVDECATVDSCIDDLESIYNAGGYKTHFKQIDDCIRKVEKKQVVVVGAYASVGKTDFAIEYMLRAICCEHQKAVFFSLEMPKGKLIERVIAKLLKIQIYDVEGYIRNKDQKVLDAMALLKDNLIIIDSNSLSMDDIERRVNVINNKELLGGPIDIVFVDYFGYLSGTDETADASASARKMKGIAKSNNLIFVMLSQLNRGGSEYGEPIMSQLKLTGDLEASADILFLMWRPGKDPGLSLQERDSLKFTTMLKIAKTRDGMYGPPICSFTYDTLTSRWRDIIK